ncbi:aminotransferase class V-fold PLP-dependent enzyme [Demequina sp.]|uniref:aminotransferase class V-fold PLP-dependent enzyme n=1 Tax=Demequina sp. TaxID=2050685 RepID=UPI003A8A57C4
MSVRRVFLDSSGRSPITSRTAQAFQAGLADGWADPARLTAESRKARAILDGATEAIADALGAHPAHVHFTMGSHVAFDRSLAGVAKARRGRSTIVAGAIERQAVLESARHASDTLVRVDVDRDGHLLLDDFAQAVSHPDVSVAAVQHGNHEIGTVQRLDALADAAAAAAVPLVVDASATIGHTEAPERWDVLVADPADWGAPLGLGVIAMRPRTRWLAAWPGEGFSPGGVSIPLALAAAVALQERLENLEDTRTRLTALTDRMRQVLAQLEGVTVVGDPHERLPHLITAAFMYLDGEPLVSSLDRAGFAVGSGSACGSDTFEPSQVLAAMGALTHGNLRIGLTPDVREEDIERFLVTLPRVMEDVRRSMTA